VARGGGRPGTTRAEGDGFFIDFPSEKTIKKVEERTEGWAIGVFLYKDECTLLFSSPRGDQALEGDGRTRTDKAHEKWAREDAYSRYFPFIVVFFSLYCRFLTLSVPVCPFPGGRRFRL
jgi:hypothetical protein